jgi:hypothetical protein
MIQVSPAILPNLVSLIPYHSGLDTLYFTCSAVLIILAWRLTKIKITRSAFSADFKPKD